MRLRAFAIALLLATPALAAEPAPPAQPDVVLEPRAAVSDLLELMRAFAVLHPELATPAAIHAFQVAGACLEMQPQAGMVRDTGRCPDVSAALKARDAAAKPAEKATPPKH